MLVHQANQDNQAEHVHLVDQVQVIQQQVQQQQPGQVQQQQQAYAPMVILQPKTLEEMKADLNRPGITARETQTAMRIYA